MAADSDGCTLTTVVTCEGNLGDPDFPRRLDRVISTLNDILGKVVKVHKLEPWNSVRVTLSIPREAALRLRQLASEGSHLLKALGILSVQVEGDQVISLRIAPGPLASEPQEIVLRTSQDGPSTSSSNVSLGRSEFEGPLARLFSGSSGTSAVTVASSSATASEKVQFKSPNVVCPADSVVPKVAVSNSPTPSKNPFPFTSMNQAIHSREVSHQHQQQNSSVPLAAVSVPVATVPIPVATVPIPAVPAVPPPPYPSQNPPVSISSPLLVNLLQNDGPDSVLSVPPASNAVKFKCPRTVTSNNNNNSAVANLPQTNSNINVSVNSNVSPSALSNKHQMISTTPCALNVCATQPPPLNNLPISRCTPPLLPPPPYPSTWASPTHLPDITPSLTDLKADDLDQLLPSLEHDFVHSPPDLPEILTNSTHHDHLGNSMLDSPDPEPAGKNFLINPLTGELEPQSSGESEVEDDVRDVFTDLPSPAAPFSDEDTSSTSKTDNPMNNITDQSDSDTRSSLIETNVKHRYKNIKSSKDKGRDSPSLKPTEKIKLRLKLEKSEPVNPAYKVDVSFINTQLPKKALVASVTPSPPPQTPPSSEGLRVPPLHISLRGRNLVITNKKRNKFLGEGGEKLKIRKNQDYALKKKDDILPVGEDNLNISVPVIDASSDQSKARSSNSDSKKIKKPKLNHEYKDGLHLGPQFITQESKVVLHNHQVKDKQKERRGSDSELAKASKKFLDSNGIISDEKKRRLSQSDGVESTEVLGSTNIGTMVGLPKPRKEKVKNRELNRNKSYSKNLAEKLAKQQQITLPTGEIDMEAKFKQRLLEGVSRPPHRTEQTTPAPEKPPPIEEKLPEPDKCNTPERKGEIGEKPAAGRSPNSGAQGEDSGIESMDALSEKSPNQASQSPHADLPESVLKSKTQVPDMMDIEAQLAKMEGLNGGDDCCISSALQDSLKQGTVTLSVHSNNSDNSPKENKSYNEDEVTLTPTNSGNLPSNPMDKEEDSEPLPLRVAPPLYTYSNQEKSRDSEDNYDEEPENNTGQNAMKNKSLLEALLIEIPTDQQHPDSQSPATRSVRTRASSKLNSPEINLNSPVTRQQRGTTPANKRKRHESDSSNHSTEEVRKKTRKTNENNDFKQTVTEQFVPKINSAKKTISTGNLTANVKNNDESSDSDEPLIEKMRKSNNVPVVIASSLSSSSITTVITNAISTVSSTKAKVKPSVPLAKNPVTNNAPLSTRRSVRSAMPAQNTRSKGDIKVHVDTTTMAADAVRRKTRSAVVDMELKRKKEVK